MTQMPNNTFFDDTLALARDPYRFISKQCERHGSDVFQTRLLLQKVICVRGDEAARVFYDTSRFSRVGVAPSRIAKTLFGRGGVQGMDGKAHCHRKMMFMSLILMAPTVFGLNIYALAEILFVKIYDTAAITTNNIKHRSAF